jgi:putative nucleotidyltransferase with HDIG domain
MKAEVSTFARKSGKPPSLPAICQELTAAVENPESSIEQVSAIIRKDQGLAARILKLSNSAFYGIPSQVGTLDEAVQIIGLREIQDLVLATSVISVFDKIPPKLVDVPSFWRHSIACGIAAALLAEAQHDPIPERLFVGGLLHDIGRLMLFVNAPEVSRQVLKRCEQEGALASQLERELAGFDHATLGAELIGQWGLPQTLAEMVGCHHSPSQAVVVTMDAFMIHYADFIVSALEYGQSGELSVSPLSVPRYCERCLLDDSRMEGLVKELDYRCEEVFPILLET